MTVRRNGWTMLVIPAIATEDQVYKIGPGTNDVYRRRKGEVLLPNREPQAVIDEIRTAIGTMNFAAQYQQNPAPPSGNVIQREWLRYYDLEPDEFDWTICTWDTASTVKERSSYSVGQLWGVKGTDFYLLANERGRYESPTLRRAIIQSMEDWKPDVTLIERTELGRALAQEIWDTTDYRPRLKSVTIDKQARLEAVAPRFELGEVFLPEHASWLEEYESELLGFPFEKYDDQVDATSLALNHIIHRNARRKPLQRRNPVRRTIQRA